MVTKTIGPLHFEDLEPHRFEDLVRNLLYDFRDWSSVEATGRGGSDDGYDARAWERVSAGPSESGGVDDESADESGSAPIDEQWRLRPWMIQCKREKRLGPSEVTRIINQSITDAEPPYGFILAAPVSFSKKAYDAFRMALRAKGVMEFYLWGKAELEDLLFLPKNDRVLFAFMGVSLASKRRTRTTEQRTAVTVKNKLIRVLGGGEVGRRLHQSILVRDIHDNDYPYEDEVAAFDSRPPWQEMVVTEFHPLGLLVEARRHFAFVDQETKRFDIVKEFNLVTLQSDREARSESWEEQRKVAEWHERLPKRHRGTYVYTGLIKFKDILLVDEKGDVKFSFPHLFLDLELGRSPDGPYGPFSGHAIGITLPDHTYVDLRAKGYRRAKIVPRPLPDLAEPVRVTDRKFALESKYQFRLREDSTVVFDPDGRYGDLKPGQMVELEAPVRDNGPTWVEVVEVFSGTAKQCVTTFHLGSIDYLERELGIKVKASAPIRAIELRSRYVFDKTPNQ